MDCRKERISVGKINLSVITAGPRDGAAVVVLHGFPERAESWQVQIDQLVKQGFFVIAPEQRGYDESDKPKEVSAYRLDTLAQDILLIMDHYQIKEAHLIGHDWGCVVGWYLVSFHADRIKKAVLLSSPHWEVFRKHLLTNPKQMLKSWYMFAIQLPFLPEMIIQSGHFHYFQKAIASSSFFSPYPQSELKTLRESWEKNSSMPSMLNWYRAMRQLSVSAPRRKIETRILLILGEKDPFISTSMGRDSLSLCERANLVVLEGVGHWPHHEKPLDVSRLISSHFTV